MVDLTLRAGDHVEHDLFEDHPASSHTCSAGQERTDGGTVRAMTEQTSHQDVVKATAEAEATMRPQQVPINMYETTEAVVVVAPLPAVAAEDVTIELRPGVLRFWAHLRSAGPREHLVHEWDYGAYERTIDIGEGYGAPVTASLGKGQLVVSLAAAGGQLRANSSPT